MDDHKSISVPTEVSSGAFADAEPAGTPEDQPPIPVRMLNEFTYCPRLGYLMWVQGEFSDSADTLDGKFQHRRVDRQRSRRKTSQTNDLDKAEQIIHERSVSLTSERLGLTAKIDLVESQGSTATPVDYKRGKRPHVEAGAWEPERVQLCAQGLLLREAGYNCQAGVLYFAGSRERVQVVFDEALTTRTLQLAEDFRKASRQEIVPPPLSDSPKCPRCALAAICLPDEVNLASGAAASKTTRRLFPARDDALPLHVQHQGARIGKSGDTLLVKDKDKLLAEVRINEVSHLVLFGGVHVSTPALQNLCQRGIPISYLSNGGWFYGLTHGMSHKNIELRRCQFEAAREPSRCLSLARRFIQAKIQNCRTLLRRNGQELDEALLAEIKSDWQRAGEALSLDALMGFEGMAARRYFGTFQSMLNTSEMAFDFQARNRRPPRDPINAMLSLGYAMLAREWTSTLLSVGFDPFLGFLHQPRYGRPALALDLMEEFRPLVADSVVLTVINNGEVKGADFIRAMGSVALSTAGRRKFIAAYERRMSQEITHPIFGYKISYRRVLEVQARLLARHLAGEIQDYPAFTTR